MNALLTHSCRNVNQATEISQTPPEGSSTYRVPPGTSAYSMPSETIAYSTPTETGVDVCRVVTPYDVDTHQPELTSSRPSHNAGGVSPNLPSLSA